MEPLTLFASFIGLIGVIHLASTAAERFGKGIYFSGNRQGKREDWYCFFQPSDLLGTTDTSSKQSSGITDAEHLEQRRRQQANRPRIQS